MVILAIPFFWPVVSGLDYGLSRTRPEDLVRHHHPRRRRARADHPAGRAQRLHHQLAGAGRADARDLQGRRCPSSLTEIDPGDDARRLPGDLAHPAAPAAIGGGHARHVRSGARHADRRRRAARPAEGGRASTYIFANSGTDFPPIIEGLAEAAAKGIDLPQALVMPHESAAMGMAHGYYLATGRGQAVIAHTNVGLANCAIGAINAAVEHVPTLLFSGRTPTTEEGRFGARTVPIGWGQEMRDQTALVREACKWDYELRFPEQVPELLDRRLRDRQLDAARAGLRQPAARGAVRAGAGRGARRAAADGAGGGAAGGGGDRRGGAHPGGGRASGDLRPARRGQRRGLRRARVDGGAWGIPVCQYWALALAVPTTIRWRRRTIPRRCWRAADAILVLDALAPWSPQVHRPRPAARVIQHGTGSARGADAGAQLPLRPVDPLRPR